MKKPEVMAPAGNKMCLRAAVDAGCDAVFFGLNKFSMRAAASNFSVSEMRWLVDYCHKRNVRAYLTVNVIAYEDELKKFEKILRYAKDAGVDAIIAWDFGVLTLARQIGLEVMISTQMSVSNSNSIRFIHESFAAKRFVLARECSLDQIKQMRKTLDASGLSQIELEAFAHGAMCVAQSGRCFMSEHQHGKSANRGECLQPCRREYKITDVEEKLSFTMGPDYVMSPKDLCTLPFIEKLIESGVNSLKIEGRNRSPEYVSIAVKAYRDTVDFYFDQKGKSGWKERFSQFKEEQVEKLETIYHRGFSTGFYMGKPINEWTQSAGSQASTRKVYLGPIINFFKKRNAALLHIQAKGIKNGDLIQIEGPTTGMFRINIDDIRDNGVQLSSADVGMKVTVQTTRLARKNDKVYLIQKK